MQPISQNNPNMHKGPSSSKDFNKLHGEMHHDLMTLFTVANRHEREIKSNMDVLLRENFFLQNKVTELEKLYDKVAKDFSYKEEGVQKQRLIKTFYNLEGLSDGEAGKEAMVSPSYGYLSIPPSDIVSKISYESDDGQVVIPESMEVSVLESNNTRPIDESTGVREYYTIEDDEVDLAFDRNKNSFWVRTSSFPKDSGVSEVYGIMHIKLPLDALNNIHVNTLYLNPFPAYSMSIRDITYKGYGDQWYRLPNYPTEKDVDGQEVPVEIEGIGKRIFSFPKTEITEIQIMFEQPYWFDSEGNRDFVYGFQEIGVEHRIYNSNVAEVVSEFSLEGTTKNFQVIEEPTVTPMLGSEQDIGDLIEHKLFYNKALTNEFGFGNEIMAPIKTVYVKTIITGKGESFPMVKSINLDYTFKDDEE